MTTPEDMTDPRSSQASPVLAPNSAIGDIIAKLESATGPDGFLNGEILEFLGWTSLGSRVFAPNGQRSLKVPDLLGSLDASLALVEERLPGWRVAINSDSHRGPPWAAAVKPHGASWPAPTAMCMSWTPALAVLLALFKALEDQHD